MSNKPLYASDFLTGVLAALAVRNVARLSIDGNRLHQAMERLFEDLRVEAINANLDLRFRIRTHPVHGDSTVLHDALNDAAGRNLIGWINPHYQTLRLKISPESAPSFLERVPGSPDMYGRLADRLLEYYGH